MKGKPYQDKSSERLSAVRQSKKFFWFTYEKWLNIHAEYEGFDSGKWEQHGDHYWWKMYRKWCMFNKYKLFSLGTTYIKLGKANKFLGMED